MFEFGYLMESEVRIVGGKEKRYQKKTPISYVLAPAADDNNSGGSNGSTENGGTQNGGSNSGSSTGDNTGGNSTGGGTTGGDNGGEEGDMN